MKFSPIIPALTFLILAGCSSNSDITVLDPASTEDISASEIIQLSFAGATFVAVDELSADPASGEGTVSFTDDTVTWAHSGLVEVGSYSDTGDSVLVASFPDQDIAFEEFGFDLVWDSLSYKRTVGTLFDSQESMVAYLDGTTFNTIGQLDSGELQPANLADQAIGNWSLQFDGDEIFWAVGSSASVGTYTYVNDKSFKANFPDREVTVVVLNQEQLVVVNQDQFGVSVSPPQCVIFLGDDGSIFDECTEGAAPSVNDSVVYHKDLTNQFDSQEALVAFLDGGSFRSTGLRPIGETSPGITAVGYWFVDFTGNTFTWAYEGVSEAGTVSYLDGNTFTAILADSELTIDVEGDTILWDSVRYRKVIGE